MKVVPPLYDVVVLGCTSEWWTIAGHERVISGPIGEEYVLGQSWLIQPAQCEDLAKAEAEWRRLAEELHVLREKVAKEGTGTRSVGDGRARRQRLRNLVVSESAGRKYATAAGFAYENTRSTGEAAGRDVNRMPALRPLGHVVLAAWGRLVRPSTDCAMRPSGYASVV